MMIHTEISFIRQRSDDGFGFDCMKAAYMFGITGRMDYNHLVKIQAEGEQRNIDEFIAWIKENVSELTEITYYHSSYYQSKFKEFDIYRHSA